jgi:glycosyltransferase involved in cell wall biosynthesis
MFYAGLAGRLSGRSVIWHLRISDQDLQLDWLLVRMATRIIAISEAVKARLKRWPRAHGRCIVVPNGLDLAAFVAAKEQAVVRGSLGIGPEERVIGLVGRLVPFKGHRYLIQAFADVRLRHPSARLLVVGDGPERDKLEQQVGDMGLKGAVHFTGHRCDVPDMLSIMEIFVLPSLGEHFGRVLLEAMALEKPVVGTRAGGVPEVVEDGVTGVLVPPANPEALAEGIIRLLDDPAQARAMGRAGRRRVETHFNLRRHAELVEEVYTQTLSGRS